MQHNYNSLNRNEYRKSLIDFVSPHFKDGDLALTLTYKETLKQHSPKYQPDFIKFAADVRHFLNRVNRQFLGDNKAKRQKLSIGYSFEQNYSQGVHIHMILQAPPTDRVPQSEHINTLINIWASMKKTGIASAIKVKKTYYSHGWVKYMFKKANKRNSERFDFSGWHLPITVEATS